MRIVACKFCVFARRSFSLGVMMTLGVVVSVVSLPSWGDDAAVGRMVPSDWMTGDIDPAELEAVRDRLLEGLSGFDEEDWPKWPWRGRVTTRVYPGTQAARKGVAAGDVFTHGADEPLIWVGDLNRVTDRHPDRPVEFRLVRPGVKTYSMVAEPGRIGFHHLPYEGRIGGYLRFGQRDPRWDRWMLAALRAESERQTDWVAALLDAAVRAGYRPDQLTDGMLVRNLLDRGRWDEAGHWAALAGVASEDQPLGTDPEDFFHAARAVGRWDDMMRVVEAHPREFLDSRPVQERAWLVRLAEARPAAGDGPAEVADRADDHVSLNAELVGVDGATFGDKPGWLDDEVRAGEPFLARQVPGRYTQAYLQRPRGIGNFDLKSRFTFVPTGESHMRWPNAISIGLVDLDRAAQWEDNVSDYWDGPHAVLMLSIQNEGRWPAERSVLSLRSHGLSSSYAHRSPWLVADGQTPVDVRLVRAGGMGEIQVNGRTVLAMPVDPAARNLGLHLHVVGYQVEFDHFHLSRFGEIELPEGLVGNDHGGDAPPALATRGVAHRFATE